MIINSTVPNNTVIFRYINILKFLDLLIKKSLFFSNYKYFSDRYEKEFTNKYLQNFAVKARTSIVDDNMKGLINYYNNRYVNCWNISNSEEYLLWKSYCHNINHGVAIKSSVKRLTDSLDKFNKDIIFTCRKINYIPYSSISQDTMDVEYPIFTKYNFYSSENEFRISCIVDHCETNEKGVYVPIDLNILIDSIILNVHSNYYQTIVSIIKKVMGVDFLNQKLQNSSISDTSLMT